MNLNNNNNNNNENKIEDILEKETLHSSWMRTMIQLISIGLVLIAYFKENKELKNLIYLPIIIIILALIIGLNSVYLTYYQKTKNIKNYNWKYITMFILFTFIVCSIYIISYL